MIDRKALLKETANIEDIVLSNIEKALRLEASKGRTDATFNAFWALGDVQTCNFIYNNPDILRRYGYRVETSCTGSSEFATVYWSDNE